MNSAPEIQTTCGTTIYAAAATCTSPRIDANGDIVIGSITLEQAHQIVTRFAPKTGHLEGSAFIADTIRVMSQTEAGRAHINACVEAAITSATEWTGGNGGSRQYGSTSRHHYLDSNRPMLLAAAAQVRVEQPNLLDGDSDQWLAEHIDAETLAEHQAATWRINTDSWQSFDGVHDDSGYQLLCGDCLSHHDREKVLKRAQRRAQLGRRLDGK